MNDEYEMEYTREDELLERITELEEENAKLKAYNEKLLNGDIEKHNKIVEFEKKISVLLSCKNCSENKGGYICQKEYEDKCLAQKIQYIKELQEENKKWKDEWQEQVQKENNESYARTLQTIQLNKAKEIIKRLMDIINHDLKCFDTMAGLDIKQKAEQFLKECE